jgi:FSR family fosmidomycin resistance protein-like MFS transporter
VLVLAIMTTVGLEGTPLLMLPGLVLGLAAWLTVPDQPSRQRERRPFLDLQLVAGPVGGLTLATVLLFVPVVAFGAAIGIWLVAEQGVARDAPLIGWTLSAFSLAAAAGGIAAGAVAPSVSARFAVGGSLFAALLPLYALFVVEVGSVAWFAAVMLAGALLNAPMPILVVTAQNLVPRSVAAASGMLHGLAHGIAGILYIGVGALQGVVGIGAALAYTFALPGLAALVGVVVLTRIARSPTQPAADCTCRVCRCTMPISCACVA